MFSQAPVSFEMDPTRLLTSVLRCSQFEAYVHILRLRGTHLQPGNVEIIAGIDVEMKHHFQTLRSGCSGTQRPFALLEVIEHADAHSVLLVVHV